MDVHKYGLAVGCHEEALKMLNVKKVEVEEEVSRLQGLHLQIIFLLFCEHNLFYFSAILILGFECVCMCRSIMLKGI